MKPRVAVIYGGRSGEHEVSLQSAASVIKNFDQHRYTVIPIGIDKSGQWWLNRLEDVFTATGEAVKVKSASAKTLSDQHLLDPAARPFDIAFPVMHGPFYEDGSIQGLFEIFTIPYVGCGVRSSAIAMDKVVTKQVVQAVNIPVLPWCVLRRGEWLRNSSQCIEELIATMKFPLFVKSVSSGSSVGMHKVEQLSDLKTAIEDVFRYDNKIIVEHGINADEIELAVLSDLNCSEPPFVSVTGEIKVAAHHDYYSYEAKYIDPDGAELLIPSRLTDVDAAKAAKIARDAFIALDCEGMARVDLLRDRASGQMYLNEINPIPGFTKISMYPRLCQASGIAYTELLTRLVELAVKRFDRQQQLKRDWDFVAPVCKVTDGN